MTPQTVLLMIAAAGVALAVFTVPYYAFFKRPAPPPQVQHRMAIILIFFGIASLMSIIFGVSGLFEVKNNALFAFSVAGPYAAFLGGLCIYLQWYDKIPPDPFHVGNTSHSHLQDIEATERAAGLLPFKEWLHGLDGFQDIKGPNKEYVMRNLLEAAFTPYSDARIDDAKVTTLFVYLRKTVVKLQRIKGARKGAEAQIRFRSNSSYGGGGIGSLILIANESETLQVRDVFTDADHIGTLAQGYVSFVQARVDCLIVSRYEEFPKTDDYLLVDMSRFSHENRGTLDFAVASLSKKMKTPQVWQMRHASVIREGEIPIAFRLMPGLPLKGLGEIERQLAPWLQAADNWLSQTKSSLGSEYMNRILAEFADALEQPSTDLKWQDVPKVLLKRQSYALSVPESKDTTVLLFNWE